jgi:two-component system sensor kinase FixL
MKVKETNMLTRIRQSLAPPVFKDKDKTRTVSLLNTTLIAIFVTVLLIPGLLYLVNLGSDTYPLDVPALFVCLIIAIGTFGLWHLMRRGHVQLVSVLTSSFLLLILVINGYLFDGLRSHASAAFTLVIILSSLLLPGRSGIAFFTLSSIAGLVGLYYAETQGWIVYNPGPIRHLDWMMRATILAVTGVMLRYTTRSLNKALERAWHNESALFESNRELQSEIAERVRTQEALAQSVSLLQATLESTADGILVVDKVGKIVNFNQRFAEMWRLPDEVLASKDDDRALAFVLGQLCDPDQFIAKVQALHSRPEAESFDVLEFNDGRVFERYSQPQRIETQVVGRVWSFRDVTERKQTQDELEQQNARLKALYQVGQIVNSTLDTDAILDRLTDAALRVTRATHGQVLVVREQEGRFERRSQRGFLPQEIERARTTPLPLNQGINGRAYASHQTVCVDDVEAEPGYFPLIPSTRTELAVPIIRKGKVTGNLDLQSPEVGAFRDADLDYLKALADQAAIALDNAQLYAETQKRLREQSALRKAAETISSTLDLEAVLSRIAQQMGQAIDATSAYICSWEPETTTSVVLADYISPRACAQEQASDLGATYQVNDVKFVQALQTGQYDVSQIEAPDLTESEKAHMQRYGAQTILYIPLQIRGQSIGYAELWESRQRREFTTDEIVLCQGIAQQAAVSIENARLYERAQQEITERIRTEQALRESQEHFRSIFENALVGLYRTTPDGRILMANPTLLRLLDYSSFEELVQRDLEENGYEPHYPRSSFKQRIESEGRIVGLESAWARRDGSIVFVRESATAVRDESGNTLYYEGTIEDITALKQTEKALKTYAARLERSNRDLEDFAYVASHDLQEPLRKVKAFGDRLKARYAKALDERGVDYLERMQSAAERMQNLINALLTYSRVSTRAQPFVPVDLAQLAQEVLFDLEIRIEQAGGRVEIGDLPTIQADPVQMRQLLQNLIGNALKFHREDTPPIVKIHTLLPDNQTRQYNDEMRQIIIQDNGIGFDEKYLDRIFQVFQRLHGRDKYEGTGIGLATCRKIVERHEGSITAKSAPGHGATFIITLPIKQSAGETR